MFHLLLFSVVSATASDYTEVSFAKLGVLDGTNKLLNGKNVSVQGFMLPIETEDDGKVKSFVLIKNRMSCCYGVPPQITEFIEVRMQKDKHAEFLIDRVVTVIGKFEVGAKVEDGTVISLYRMEAEKVVVPEGSENMAEKIKQLQKDLQGQ